jgi:hypothetical protein
VSEPESIFFAPPCSLIIRQNNRVDNSPLALAKLIYSESYDNPRVGYRKTHAALSKIGWRVSQQITIMGGAKVSIHRLCRRHAWLIRQLWKNLKSNLLV